MAPLIATFTVVGGVLGFAVHTHLHPGWRDADLLHQFQAPAFIAAGMGAGVLAAAAAGVLITLVGISLRGRPTLPGSPTVRAGDGFAWSADRVAGGSGYLEIGADVPVSAAEMAEAFGPPVRVLSADVAAFTESVLRDIDRLEEGSP